MLMELSAACITECNFVKKDPEVALEPDCGPQVGGETKDIVAFTVIAVCR